MSGVKELLDQYGLRGNERTRAMQSIARELIRLRVMVTEFRGAYPSATEAFAWMERWIAELERRLAAGHVAHVDVVTP